MTDEALNALQESIAHWRRLATGNREPDESTGASSCALCKLYIDNFRCRGCPVAEAGHVGCDGTPYGEAATLVERGLDPDPDASFEERQAQRAINRAVNRATPEFRAAAQKELEFLESLLPPAAGAS